MNKRRFAALVILMSLSLIGIIAVQVYWIQRTVEDKEQQFSTTIKTIMEKVTDRIETRERQDYWNQLLLLSDSVGKPKSSQIKNFFFVDRDINNNEIRFYQHGILEESYDISSMFFDNGFEDTQEIKNITSRRTEAIYQENVGVDGRINSLTPIQRVEKINGLSAIDKLAFEDVFMEAAKSKPIHERVQKQEIELLLQNELKSKDIVIDFEYGIYNEGFPTKIKSKKFKFDTSMVYQYPIFKDSEGNSSFVLLLTFPKKKKFLLESILFMAMLSLAFTLVIVLAYSSALYQLIQQKQISEIKTDFINNMTHEFKTPIATINLAIEAIKNPQSLKDEDKVLRYLGMIKEENKRMHAQVENVLRISKLEKNQLDIEKDRVDVHEIIEDAITHIELIVQDRGGTITKIMDANRSDVLANEVHFTNVLVNILDNAIKYSPEAPEITIATVVVKNQIVISISDKGSGMSKSVQKRVFEKFYREHTGNIHNVKGHGLGLAYVKKIVDDHQGEVLVESEKDKGSTFYVKLPLIQ